MRLLGWLRRALYPSEPAEPFPLDEALHAAAQPISAAFGDCDGWDYRPPLPDPHPETVNEQAFSMAADHILPLFHEETITVIRSIAARPDVQAKLDRLGYSRVLRNFSRCRKGREKPLLFRAIAETLRCAAPRDLFHLVTSLHFLTQDATCLSAPRLPRFSAYPPEAALPMAGIISLLARDGHVREAAVRSMNRWLEPSAGPLPAGLAAAALPYVVMRVCEWVPQVRAAAAGTLEFLLPRLEIGDFFAADAFLQLLERSRRAPPEAAQHTAGRIVSLFQQPAIRDEPCLRSRDGGRQVWRIAAERADDIPDSVWCFLMENGPPPARLAAADRRSLPWTEDHWQRRLAASSEPDPRVRRAWLWRYAREKSAVPAAEDCIAKCLFDPSSLVRSAAVSALRGLNREPAQLYREAVRPVVAAGPDGVPGAWALGLAAAAEEQDAGWFRLWLASAKAELRTAGLLGLGRISPDEADRAALRLLWDERRAPRRAAARWLTERDRPEHVQELRRCFAEGGPSARRTARRILLQRGMERAADIFAALPDKEFQPASWDAFIAWARRYGWHAASGSAPYVWKTLSPASRAVIREAWEKLAAECTYELPERSPWELERLLDRFPAPYDPPANPRASLGNVPYEAWRHWSSFPRLLEELYAGDRKK